MFYHLRCGFFFRVGSGSGFSQRLESAYGIFSDSSIIRTMVRIDDRSPLYNLDAAALDASPLEIIVWVTGHAEGASEIFQARSVHLGHNLYF